MELDPTKIVHPPACRCGHTGGDIGHPCHGYAYTCRKPATQRFYNPRLVSLSGQQMKLEVAQTWACDECWAINGSKDASTIKTMAPSSEPNTGWEG